MTENQYTKLESLPDREAVEAWLRKWGQHFERGAYYQRGWERVFVDVAKGMEDPLMGGGIEEQADCFGYYSYDLETNSPIDRKLRDVRDTKQDLYSFMSSLRTYRDGNDGHGRKFSKYHADNILEAHKVFSRFVDILPLGSKARELAAQAITEFPGLENLGLVVDESLSAKAEDVREAIGRDLSDWETMRQRSSSAEGIHSHIFFKLGKAAGIEFKGASISANGHMVVDIISQTRNVDSNLIKSAKAFAYGIREALGCELIDENGSSTNKIVFVSPPKSELGEYLKLKIGFGAAPAHLLLLDTITAGERIEAAKKVGFVDRLAGKDPLKQIEYEIVQGEERRSQRNGGGSWSLSAD